MRLGSGLWAVGSHTEPSFQKEPERARTGCRCDAGQQEEQGAACKVGERKQARGAKHCLAAGSSRDIEPLT